MNYQIILNGFPSPCFTIASKSICNSSYKKIFISITTFISSGVTGGTKKQELTKVILISRTLLKMKKMIVVATVMITTRGRSLNIESHGKNQLLLLLSSTLM